MNHQSDNTSQQQVDRGGPRAMESPLYAVLNKGADDQLLCLGYRDNACKLVLYYILVVLTLGLFLLVMKWKPEWELKLKKSQCRLSEADTVLLKDPHGQLYPEKVVLEPVVGSQLGIHEFVTYHGKKNGSVSDGYGSATSSEDDTASLAIRQKSFIKYFDHHHMRYIWRDDLKVFTKLSGLDSGMTCAVLHDGFNGLTDEERTNKCTVYGKNNINVEVKSYWSLFFDEILNPFYIFQIASIILWSVDEYYVYASCIVFISAVSLGISLYETRKQSQTLRDMVAAADSTISIVQGNGDITLVSTNDLVPGDVIIVPAHGCMMTCDAVLVSGNVIVNESMLTGESVPVTKTPLAPSEANEEYCPMEHKRHTLFCGTKVIQTRYYGDAKVKAVVVRTGFSTAKGELVQSILYPKPIGFKFYKDSMRFIMFLACIAALGMTYSIIILVLNGEDVKKVIIRALDIITIVVPPALPAAMTVGTVYAQNRLKKQGIFCISPPRINVCGKLKLICFDKTGTLTEDGMDLWGVVPLQENRFLRAVQNPTELPTHGPFVMAMATCHSLTIIDGEVTGDPLDLKMFNSVNWILEEPGKDTSKFDSLVPTVVKPITRDTYYCENPDETQFEVGIVRQFTFSSSLQRMSVLTRTLGASHMDIFAKGAPEKIASLCKKQSLPEDFHHVLKKYTMKGFRVIALAWKPLDSKLTWPQAQRISRDSVESELNFLGLLIMENTLKPQTTPVIHELQNADIRTVMITGDNMLTAISVARQCGMVSPKNKVILVNAYPPEMDKRARIHWECATSDPNVDSTDDDQEEEEEEHFMQSGEEETQGGSQNMVDMNNLPTSSLYQSSCVNMDEDEGKYHLAITGRSFAVIKQYFPDLMPRLCIKGTIFARMSPDQKSQLVENLQDLGYGVGMCGDGANDCGALKAAHAGISLSEAEASVASPFTSRTANIECVPTVIREGRAALVTSFGIFKYMALYSFVQFVSVLILYSNDTNLGDWMFLYIDLVITTTVAVLMGHTGAYHKLSRRRPPGSLVSPGNLFSIIAHILLVIAFQTGIYGLLTTQPWFTPSMHLDHRGKDHVIVWETTVIFCISSFQYIMLAFIFSKGKPYRKPIWTNVPFLVALVFLTGFTTMLTLHPFSFLSRILQFKDIPGKYFLFRVTILGFVCCHFCLAFLLETWVVPSEKFNRLLNRLRRKKTPKNKHKIVELEIENDSTWPPMDVTTLSSSAYHLDTGDTFITVTAH